MYAPEYFQFLAPSGCYTVDNIDDVKDFNATKHAMEVMGFTSDERHYVLQTLAAILHLGNITFSEENNHAVIDDNGRM